MLLASVLLCVAVFGQTGCFHRDGGPGEAKAPQRQARPKGKGIPNPLVAYYIDFQLETFVAVTPETIRRERVANRPSGYSTRLVIADAGTVGALLALVGRTTRPARFDSMKVRLLLDQGADRPIVLVDNAGTVLSEGESKSLDPVAFRELRHLLNTETARQKQVKPPRS
jgi:hypothetical protein